MNPVNILLTLISITLIFGTCATDAVLQRRVHSLTIGNYHYFGNTEELRSREEAVTYYMDQEAELAQVSNRNIFIRLRNYIRTPGSYWINGIDRPDVFRFHFTSECQDNGAVFDFRGMRPENMGLPQVSCLSFVKGSNARNTKIQAAHCTEERFVICQSPIDGCEVVNTMPAVSRRPTTSITRVPTTPSIASNTVLITSSTKAPASSNTAATTAHSIVGTTSTSVNTVPINAAPSTVTTSYSAVTTAPSTITTAPSTVTTATSSTTKTSSTQTTAPDMFTIIPPTNPVTTTVSTITISTSSTISPITTTTTTVAPEAVAAPVTVRTETFTFTTSSATISVNVDNSA